MSKRDSILKFIEGKVLEHFGEEFLGKRGKNSDGL